MRRRAAALASQLTAEIQSLFNVAHEFNNIDGLARLCIFYLFVSPSVHTENTRFRLACISPALWCWVRIARYAVDKTHCINVHVSDREKFI